MAKKPRSQRRKKGVGLEGAGGGDETTGGTAKEEGVEVLSEDHTIADSVTSAFSGFDDEEFVVDVDDTDDVLRGGAGAGGGDSSADAAESAAQKRYQRLQDILSVLRDDFGTEKRSAKREAHLRHTFKALTAYAADGAAYEAVSMQYRDAIFQASTRYSLMRAGAQPAEQYAACRVLQAAAMCLGADEDDWCEAVLVPLKRVVQLHTRAPAVRGAALRAAAMTIFICGSDQMTAESFMDFTESIMAPVFRERAVPTPLRATAVDGWALMATTLDDFDLAGQDDVQMGRGLSLLPLLKECMEESSSNAASSSIDLRSAAGECVALIHEARLNLGCVERGDGDGDEGAAALKNATERRFRRGSWDGSPWEIVMEEVKQRMSELSTESGHYMSKKAKKQQRATFREFMNTLCDDELPCEVVQFRHHGSLELNSWREIIQLNFVRQCLQGGFQLQLLSNPTLRQIFGVSGLLAQQYHEGGTAHGGLSKLEKRLTLAKTSEATKNADRSMTRKRDKRTAIKNDFLTADAENLYM